MKNYYKDIFQLKEKVYKGWLWEKKYKKVEEMVQNNVKHNWTTSLKLKLKLILNDIASYIKICF